MSSGNDVSGEENGPIMFGLLGAGAGLCALAHIGPSIAAATPL